jgi:hypothetical protein
MMTVSTTSAQGTRGSPSTGGTGTDATQRRISTGDHEDPPRAAIQSLYVFLLTMQCPKQNFVGSDGIMNYFRQMSAETREGGILDCGGIFKEPLMTSLVISDIEKYMDGWSAWFDVLKGTFQVLDDEMTKK